MEFNLVINKEGYFKEFLKVMNGFLRLSKTELDIVSNILFYNKKIFDTEGRVKVRTILGQTENNFNNHIMRLKKKKVILENPNGGIELNSNIISAIKDMEITFKFNLKQSVN